MKKTILSLFLLFIIRFAFSQEDYLNMNSESRQMAEDIKKTTLLVVVDDKESELGKELIKAFFKYWKYNKFEIIKSSEIGKYITNEKYSVFSFYRTANVRSNTVYRYGVFMGDAQAESLEDAKVAAYVNVCGEDEGMEWINHESIEMVQKAMIPLTSCFILRLHQQLMDLSKNVKYSTTKVKAKSDKYGNTKITYYNNEPSVINNKKILILNDFADTLSKAKMMEAFNLSSEKVLLVNKEQMENAVEKQEPNIILVYTFASLTAAVGYSTSGEIIFEFDDFSAFTYSSISFNKYNSYQKKASKGGRIHQ